MAGGGGGSDDGGLYAGTNNGSPQGGLGGSGGGGNGGKVSPSFAPYPGGYGNLSKWTAGGTNLGGGGGGQTSYAVVYWNRCCTWWSGTVIVNEPEVNYVTGTSSCWDLRTVYQKVKAGNWT